MASASVSILVNDSPTPEFITEMGLRQGDPLSPFLYVAEGLNLLVRRAVNFGLLEAFEVGKERVVISHLQYTYDTIFVCSGKENNIKVIKQVLRLFELLSGLNVNFDKSCLFGVNISPAVVRAKANELGCEVGMGSINYLGVKVGVNHRKSDVWSPMIQKVQKRMDAWS